MKRIFKHAKKDCTQDLWCEVCLVKYCENCAKKIENHLVCHREYCNKDNLTLLPYN